MQVRTSHGWSQEEFSKRIGISKSAVYRMEKGEHIPGAEVLAKIVRGVGVSAEWLLMGLGEMKAGTGDKAEEIKLLEDRVRDLERLNSKLQQNLNEYDTRLEVLPPDHSLPVMEPGQIEPLWQIIEVLVREVSVSEERLKEELGMSAEQMRQHCLLLYRQRVLRRVGQDWALTKEALLRAASNNDVASVSRQALAIMVQRVIPGALSTRGALAVADVRVGGEGPGERLMQAIRDAFSTIEDENGQVLKVVIGVAPG